jgi:hypothetical protein
MFGAQAQVERLVTSGVEFADIENYLVDLAALPEDGKSALWLFAWAKTRLQERGHAALECLSGLVESAG